LRRDAHEHVCTACQTRFPSLDGIPWLLPEPAASLAEWRDRLQRLLLELQRMAQGAREELEAPNLLTPTRSRLKLLAQAYGDHARRLQSILAPLALDQKQTSFDVHQALRTRLPPSQDLASYYVNLHRDWVWGDEENALSARLIESVLGPSPLGKTLVVGAGACRLAYDLHQSRKPDFTVALDINPLLLLAAQRILDGKTVSLYEFPIAPRTIEHQAILRELRAPAPAAPGLHLVFADALQAPFAAGSFDTVLTPWFIDIIPADLAELAVRINRLLTDGGRWVNFGTVAFTHRQAARSYSLEEAVELVAAAGFERPQPQEATIPYMRSPASRHSRLEGVVSFAVAKVRTADPPAPWQALPEWLVRDDLPVPLLPDFQSTAMATRIQAFLMSLIDGRRSLKDMADLIVAQRLMTPEDALGSIRTFVMRMFEDSQSTRGR